MEEEEAGEEESGGGVSTEILLSYLAFAKSAIRKRIFIAAGVFIAGSTLAVAAAVLWPRTYHAETRLMAQRSDVLARRGDSTGDALRGSQDVILARENLKQIVTSLDLVRIWNERRAPILKLKDRIMASIRGPVSDKDQTEALIGLMKDKLTATVEPSDDAALTIAIDWPDARTSAKIVETAQQLFLEKRHSAEISMIADYAAILEGHAANARKDVDELAEQVKASRKSRIAEAKLAFKSKDSAKDGDKSKDTAVAAPHYTPRPRPAAEDGQAIAELKAEFDGKQQSLADLENDRRRRLLEAQQRLTDLESKYTDAHPAVVDQKQKLMQLSTPSSQATALKSELADLQDRLRRAQSASQAATGVGSTLLSSAGAAERPSDPSKLPPELEELLQDRNLIDPALAEQFESALRKYRALKDQIGSAQIDLDTAQLAFKHRYTVVAPAEVPTAPTKPKVAPIIGGGIFASLFLALALCVLAELRTDRIQQRWQLEQIALPVLADLRFPPGRSDT